MGFLEAELAKYERRVQRIAENPDPTKLRCNLLLNEMWRDHRRRMLQERQDGKPFLYLSGGGIYPYLFMAMGFRPIHLPMTADRATTGAAQYFEVSRGRGYPDTTCDRIQVELGLALSGDLPKPSFVAIATGECMPITYGAHWLAKHFQCPSYALDVDLDDNYESLRYLVRQFEEMIALAEKEVPGVKYDAAKHRTLLQKVEQVHAYEQQIYELKRAVPCPISGKDALRMAGPELVEDPRYVEYYRLFFEEMQERVARGIGVLREEKMRVMWLVSAPFYADPFSFLEKRGVAVPLYDAGAAGGDETPSLSDETAYGRKLSLLEFEASLLNRGWRRGTAERKVRFVLDRCREMHIDAIVYFMLWGCTPELSMAKIIAERAEQELGVSTLMIEGWCLDAEKYDQADFEKRLDDFIDVCLMRKGVAPA